MEEHVVSDRTTIVIGSPLEAEHAARIAAVAPDRVELIYEPELVPPARYIADHDGPVEWARSEADQRRWMEILASADVLFCLPREAKTDLLAISPKLKWLQGTSAGMGQPAQRLGLIDSDVIVTTASGVHAGALSEFVFAALLSRTRELDRMARWQRDHHWERFTGDELAGKAMTIIGPGRIGRQIARVARAFDMSVTAVGRTGGPERAAVIGVDQYLPINQLREALQTADVVVIVTPHTGGTEQLIGAAEFNAMKPGVWFINIGRGAVIDEQEMIARIRDGRIGFAALDVFQQEPLPPNSQLWDLPNTLISPHCSANAPRENERITDIFIRNLPLFLDGRYDEMSPVLDKTQMY